MNDFPTTREEVIAEIRSDLAGTFPFLGRAELTFGPVKGWMERGEDGPRCTHALLQMRSGEVFDLARDAPLPVRAEFDRLMVADGAWKWLRNLAECDNRGWGLRDETVAIDLPAAEPTASPLGVLAPRIRDLCPELLEVAFFYQPVTGECVRGQFDGAFQHVGIRTADASLRLRRTFARDRNRELDTATGVRDFANKVAEMLNAGTELPFRSRDPWGQLHAQIVRLNLSATH